MLDCYTGFKKTKNRTQPDRPDCREKHNQSWAAFFFPKNRCTCSPCRSWTHWCLIYVTETQHDDWNTKYRVSKVCVALAKLHTRRQLFLIHRNWKNCLKLLGLILVDIFCEGSLQKCVDIFFWSDGDEKRDLQTYFKTLLGSCSQLYSGFYGTAGCGSFHSEDRGRLFYESYLKQNFSHSLWKIHFKLIHSAVEQQLIQSSLEVSTLNIPSIISITLSPASVSPQVGATYVTSYQVVKRNIQFSLESKHDLLNSKALFQKQIL